MIELHHQQTGLKCRIVNIKNFLLKFFNFYNLKNLCILHGRVFVMNTSIDKEIFNCTKNAKFQPFHNQHH